MILIPNSYNYMSLFLTFSCKLGCSYCINKSGKLDRKRASLPAKEWASIVSSLPATETLPITLGGGEPTCYKEFYELCKYLPHGKVDLLTNGLFDMKEFTSKVAPSLFSRSAPYASLRISYHPGYHDPFDLLKRAAHLRALAYDVGVWAVDHPSWSEHIREMSRIASKIYKIDFRLKEFLGYYEGKEYGSYKYSKACNEIDTRSCKCKPSELLIDPAGYVFSCHRDLYANENAVGHILNSDISSKLGRWKECSNLGRCNECDLKVKYDRFQVEGHCSVEIQEKADETVK